MAKLFRTAIMGPPGSGKGTISKRIAQNFGLQYLSSGHFLREGIAANTGFPRTIAQAKALNDIFQMDLVISLNIPFETLRERVSDRWIHPASGRVYNMGFNPPQVQGRDDVTGEPLIQHADDRPEALQARLRHYKDVAKPVMNLYKCLRQEKRITQQRRSSKQTAWFPVQRHPVPVLGYRHRPHLALHQLSSQH
ncbi:adenylate kinase 4, mitochondrial isoform X6 [Gadus macrocephalus]|uniref:adenylate kinase 4, mitochondrial isoform X6 n=1 Tax=Gadus macrocephalus TaxID=80720 RepID=UPI0028CB1CF9|nr:adenylate kinase 4, mitochondrial isoform X6 [Gadus macrocephalus]